MSDIFADNTGNQQPFFPRPAQQTVYWDATGLFAATAFLMVLFLVISVGWLWHRVFCDTNEELEDSCDEEAFEL